MNDDDFCICPWDSAHNVEYGMCPFLPILQFFLTLFKKQHCLTFLKNTDFGKASNIKLGERILKLLKTVIKLHNWFPGASLIDTTTSTLDWKPIKSRQTTPFCHDDRQKKIIHGKGSKSKLFRVFCNRVRQRRQLSGFQTLFPSYLLWEKKQFKHPSSRQYTVTIQRKSTEIRTDKYEYFKYLKIIAKGTTDPRVEFMSQMLTYLLFHYLD